MSPSYVVRRVRLHGFLFSQSAKAWCSQVQLYLAAPFAPGGFWKPNVLCSHWSVNTNKFSFTYFIKCEKNCIIWSLREMWRLAVPHSKLCTWACLAERGRPPVSAGYRKVFCSAGSFLRTAKEVGWWWFTWTWSISAVPGSKSSQIHHLNNRCQKLLESQ